MMIERLGDVDVDGGDCGDDGDERMWRAGC